MTKEWQVPEFDAHEFKAKSAKYCVAVFVINENGRIRAQLEKMAALTDLVDIIIADGGSTDGSLDHGFLQEKGVRALLVKTGPGKLSAQMRMALAWAMEQGYEGVITVDGNNKDDTSAVPLFVDAMDLGIDHVQGSRFIPGGAEVNTPLSRLIGVKLLHAPMISMAAGFRYTDTTNGFRAYSKRLLEHLEILPFRDIFQKYELHYYLAIRAAQLGLSCLEVPVTRVYPDKAKEGVPTKISPLRGNLMILKTLFTACTGGYNPKNES